MARTDNDTWDLASSVGATATMVAAARAMASRAPDPLIDDPFAEPLVRAVGLEFFVRLLDGEISVDGIDNPNFNRAHVIDVMAVRTKFFDDFFADAADSGHPAGGHPCVRPGLPCLPAAVAARHRRVRNRPARR